MINFTIRIRYRMFLSSFVHLLFPTSDDDVLIVLSSACQKAWMKFFFYSGLSSYQSISSFWWCSSRLSTCARSILLCCFNELYFARCVTHNAISKFGVIEVVSQKRRISIFISDNELAYVRHPYFFLDDLDIENLLTNNVISSCFDLLFVMIA